jgi:hypothetical protein
VTLSAKENLLRAIRFARAEHVPFSAEGALRLVDYQGSRPPRQGVDHWGVTWAPLPEDYRSGTGEPAASYPVLHPCYTVTDVLSLCFPNPEDPSLFQGILADTDPSQVLVVGRHPAGPLERLGLLLGVTKALTALLEEPVACRKALDRIAAHHAGIARGYLAAGVEAGWLADDYAGQNGPLLRPELWRQMVLPGLRQIIAVYQEAGAPVFFHTCGRADDFVQDLIDAGVTVFNLESSATDLIALRAHYGRRIAFYGGIKTDLMLLGKPEDVRRAAILALADLGRDGGLILAPDQPLAFTPENESALAEIARHFGHYPLKVPM